MSTLRASVAIIWLAAAVMVAGFVVGASGLFTDSDPVGGNTFSTDAVFSPPWWDGSYGYRQPITATTGPNSPFNGYDGYSVQLLVDTATLVSAGKLQADCDDLRVVFWDLSLWTELDRDLYSCNTASTEGWFQLQADIAANTSTNSRYYLYYGKPAAAGAPANRSNVYLHYNGWSTNRLAEYAVGRQDNWHGTGTYTGFTWDSINQRVNFDTGNNFTGGLRLASFGERDVYIEQTVAYTGCYTGNVTQGPMARYSGDGTSSDNWYAFVQANSTGCNPGAYTNPAMQKDNRSSAGFCGSGSGTAWALDGATHRQGLAIWGVNSTNLKGWLDKTARKPTEPATLSCSDASDHENAGDVAWVQSQSAGSFDDFLVRRYTEPEPVMSLGTEGATVKLLDAWTTGTTHTVSAGTDHLLLVSVYGEDSGVINSVNTVTWGGQTLTEINEATVGSGYSNLVWMGYLNEAGIAAASGTTIVATWSGSTPNESVLYAAVTLENVDQTTPVGGSSNGTSTSASTVQIASSLSVDVSDMAVYVTVSGEQGQTHTADAGYTEGTEQDSGGVGQVASNATKAITANGSEQPTATWSGTNNRLAIIGAEINVAP